MWYSQLEAVKLWQGQGCELLSEFYLYVIFTAQVNLTPLYRGLWIAFRILSLCDIHSDALQLMDQNLVVNCFQNFIFMWYSQHMISKRYPSGCCELLSEFYLYVIFTAAWSLPFWRAKLWIAFRILSLCDIHSIGYILSASTRVVNCFQNFIFMWYSQPIEGREEEVDSCELLSEFYLYVIFTARLISTWRAFSCELLSEFYLYVIFTALAMTTSETGGCELLSEFYLYVIFTAQKSRIFLPGLLWIAFRILSLCDIHSAYNSGRLNWMLWIAFRILSLCDIHSMTDSFSTKRLVVNCFQNFIFMWYSQRKVCANSNEACCELLSEFYLYVIFTAHIL